MRVFIGTKDNDLITPDAVSDGVIPGRGKRRPGDGPDVIFARGGDDTVAGGRGDDRVHLGNGADRFIWNEGDGNDTVNGGGGSLDVLEFNGGDMAERITLGFNPRGHLVLTRDVDDVRMKLAGFEFFEINAGAGDDTIDASAQQDPRISLRVNGGAGNDIAFLGAGADTFVWSPGDGSDTVHGGDGRDTLLFFGSSGDEVMALATTAEGVQLTRDLGSIVMTMTETERFDIRAGGGADRIEIGDLSGRGVELVRIDTGGSDASDEVVVSGTAANDRLLVADGGAVIDVVGLPYAILISGAFGGGDVLELRPGSGSDEIDLTALGEQLGSVTLRIGAEVSDGARDLDILRGYDAERGDAIALSAGYLAAEETADGLLLSLGGADGDQLLLAGVTSLSDVIFLG